MPFRRIRTALSDLRRLREILVVAYEAGGGPLAARLRLKYLVPLRCRIHCALHRRHPDDCLVRMRGDQVSLSGDVLRGLLERLGPTFVKLGQVLSLRADVVGEAMAQQLSGLQSNVGPFSFEIVREIIRRELGQPPEQLFESFDEQPVAAASLSQVHRAALAGGSEVAVKVQRPGIERTIRQDIALLSLLARLAERHMPQCRAYAPVRLVHEFAAWTLAELDFMREGHNTDRFRYMFAENPHINVPQIHWQRTTRHVLTMDFVHGIKADDLVGMRELEVDPQQLALHGVRAMFRMFFLEGFFHADPHPGNFFALANDTLCLHDFGMVGSLDRRQRHTLLRGVLAFMNRDIDGYIAHFLQLGIVDERSDTAAYEKELDRILSELYYAPSPSSVAWAFFRAINQGAHHGVRFPPDLALFGKAVITTEAMGRKLYPGFQFDEQLQPFVRDAIDVYVKRLTRSLEGNLLEALDLADELPGRLRRILDTAERGGAAAFGRTTADRRQLSEPGRLHRKRWFVILVAVLITTGFLLAYEEIGQLAELSPAGIAVGASAALLLWLAMKTAGDGG